MTTNKNIAAAVVALSKEVGADVDREELAEYLAQLDKVVAVVREIRAEHKSAIRVEASKRSRAKKAARVAEALDLLAAKEAAEA